MTLRHRPAFVAAARGAAALALAATLSAAGPADAGGPLEVLDHQPVVYANGASALTLNLDQGSFGSRSNAQAVALVQGALALWNGVATSTVHLAVGTQLPTNYTGANYGAVLGKYADGLNPVLFDSDGSITDALFGTNAKNSVLGFAGSAYYVSGAQAGKYAEGQAVLNGYLSVSDATWTVVLAHEFGHFFGLDHSQLDGSQALAPSNYVLMYPIAYRTLASLHEDDAAAVTALYPAASAASAYGQLSGSFVTAAGAPILGANVWARELSTGKVYSSVSDYLTQGTGAFRLYLPPGSYTLQAESIQGNFTGGSGVGPYSANASDVSFQPPHPITPVALGGDGPAQLIPIVAGCSATVIFRLDGSGSVGGDCASLPTAGVTLASSQNPAPVATSVAFTATVTGTAPTGTVRFDDGGVALPGCSAVALTGGGNARSAQCTTGALAAGTHTILATYAGDAANGGAPSDPLAQVMTAASPAALVGAVSRREHGAAGSFDIALSLVASAPTVEPRAGGTATLVLAFDKPVASASIAVTEGSAAVQSTGIAGTEITVTLSGVANAQYVTVGLTGITATDGATGGSAAVRVGFLQGDVNGSRSVTVADLLAVNSVLAQPVTASNFRQDVNASGTLTLADKLAVNASLAHSLPAP